MLNINLKKQIKDLIFSYFKETIKSDVACIEPIISIKQNHLIITLELKEKLKLDWQKIEAELKERILAKVNFKKIFFIINYHQKSSSLPKLILICSAKGGVGKSTLAVNLALTAQKLGKKVGLVDADIYGPSIHHLLNAKEAAPQVENNKMIPQEAQGLKFNSMGLIIPPKKALIWRGPMLIKALDNLIKETLWGEIEYLFVDLPPGTGDIHLTLLKNYQEAEAILIATPHKIALIDVARSYDMLETLQIKIIGIIENMALPKKNQKTLVEEFALENKLNYLGKIFFDPQIAELSDQGKIAAIDGSEIAKENLRQLTNKIFCSI